MTITIGLGDVHVWAGKGKLSCEGYFNFDEGVEPLARKMYVDPEKLPLLIVTNQGLNAAYACSGYNVVSVALMEKLLCLSE